MLPSAVCDILTQILGPLTEIPFIGDIIARILDLLCPEEEPAS